MTAWPTIPVLKPIDAEVHMLQPIPEWDEAAYHAENDTMTCQDCHLIFPQQVMNRHLSDMASFYCPTCYQPDANDYGEYLHEQSIDRQLEKGN